MVCPPVSSNLIETDSAVTTLRLFPSESALAALADTPVSWRLLDGSRTRAGLDVLTRLPKAERIELFLPPARVLRTAVNLPAGARKQTRKLLPHALDPLLLAEPGEQHLAFAWVGDRCHVAALERELLAGLLDTLKQHGLRPRAVWPADALLAADGRELLWCGQGWARRHGEGAQWFDASSVAQPPALLAGLSLASLIVPDSEADTVELAAWQARFGPEFTLASGDPFCLPVQADAIDLLQGDFASGPQIDLDLSRLKPSAWLAGAAVSLLLAGWLGQWWNWHREEVLIKQQMNSAFLSTFPGTPLVDAQLQLQAMLKARQTGAPTSSDPALARLLELAPQLQAGTDSKLLSLNYAEGKLQAEYRAKPEQLSRLGESLQKLGKLETNPSGPDRVLLSLTLR